MINYFLCLHARVVQLISRFSKIHCVIALHSRLIILFTILCSVLLFSCEGDVEVQQPGAPVALDVDRLDQVWAAALPTDLEIIKGRYPRFFPASVPDSLWVQRMQDTIQLEINNEVREAFHDFTDQQAGLEQLVGNVQSYVPDYKTPRVVTTTNQVDWKYRNLVVDDLVILSLDNYLGQDHKFYAGLPLYIQKKMNPAFLVPETAQGVAEKLVGRNNSQSLLDHMVYWGKLRYLQQLFLPATSGDEIMGYTPQQWEWAQENEEQVYRFLIDRELLYNTDPSLPKRFTEVAPFTKFYLEIDQESPGRLGQYVGWNIVNQFMDREEVTWQEMLRMDANTILKQSRYKPNRS